MKKILGDSIHPFILILVLALVSGCKGRLKNPELIDPIYIDIEKELKSNEGALKDEEKRLETLKKEYSSTEPRSVERRINERELREARLKIDRLKQSIEYLGVRLERRRVEGRRAYGVAFQKGEPWPSEKEIAKYNAYRRLRTAPLSWDRRIPKLFKTSPNYQLKPEDLAQMKTSEE